MTSKLKTLYTGKTLLGFENLMIVALALTAVIIVFNQVQISAISSSFDSVTGAALATLDTSMPILTGSNDVDLSGVDVYQVNSTAMAVATVFPELKQAKSEQDVLAVMFPTGTPEYSSALGGITFDDPVTSLDYLAKWFYSFKEEVKKDDPQVWERYVSLAAAPRGISCEFCCGVGPQGVNEQGEPTCGCQHNPALLSVTLGLMKYTDYSDAQILREVMKWKTVFFPKNMIALGVQVSGQDPSELKDLPGMVGGC